MTALEVLDAGEVIRISFDDLLKYHGTGSVGGVALGFKVMERGFPLLDGGRLLERRDIHVETAFDGPGARDAFEMVTRAVTGGRYRAGARFDGDRYDVPEAPDGHFLFRLRYHGTAIDLVLRHGHVTDEFIRLVRRSPRSAAEEAHLVSLKHEMAGRLLPLPAEDVYDAHLVST